VKEEPEPSVAVPESGVTRKEILDFEEAAAFLGISTKTFAKVLRTEDLPGRKVGREWKFSRSALLAWVGSGRTREFKDESEDGEAPAHTIAQPRHAADTDRKRPLARDAFSADED
jgi:excisionase family DNA binding protein